jgi:hypothetical protein
LVSDSAGRKKCSKKEVPNRKNRGQETAKSGL